MSKYIPGNQKHRTMDCILLHVSSHITTANLLYHIANDAHICHGNPIMIYRRPEIEKCVGNGFSPIYGKCVPFIIVNIVYHFSI